jgi:transposase
MYSIGLDISKSSIAVYIPLGNLNIEIENSIKALKSLYSKLRKIYKKESDNLVFVFEPTGNYSSILYRFCADKKIQVFIINPKQSHNFAKAIAQRNKSDKVDAQMLSKAIMIARKEDIITPVVDAPVEEIKEMMGYYKIKMKQRIQLSNHLEALRAKGNNSSLVKRLQKEIKALKKTEVEIIDAIYQMIAQNETLLKKYEAIISINGIGKIAAIVLMHLFIRYPNANQRQITSLVGLDPIIRESGTSVKGKSRISKSGGRLYRGSLFMAAMVATKHNNKMKLFYNRLKENGKHTTVAQIAVMRKLVIIAHSLFKSGELYDETRHLSC